MHFCVANYKVIGLKDDTYVDPLTGITYDAFCDGARLIQVGVAAMAGLLVAVY
tara:strand:- start:97 stop:255 length:159 start_codon:yes stop_codon:yes gene_type:complete